MYICVCMCVYVCMYVCMYVCLFVCVYVCACAQVKKGGGMSINSTLTLTKMSEKLAQLILHEYSIRLPLGGVRGAWH